jgi:connective tissue growth factor
MVGDCPVQTTEWSPCSRECGWGIRERITNDKTDREMKKETKLCQLKPCHHVTSIKTMLNSNKYINKACLKTTRPKDPVTLTFSGCKSKRQYKPRYCGLCKDDRCCEPEETETVNVTFECPGNEEIVKQIDQIKKCNCSNKCQSASFDIFASNHFLNNDVQMSNLRH